MVDIFQVSVQAYLGTEDLMMADNSKIQNLQCGFFHASLSDEGREEWC